jgi:hypothetical protein
MVTQVLMEHTDVHGDGAGWDVDIEHMYAPRCEGCGTVLLVATITGMLLVHCGAHFATLSLKVKCTVCSSL